MGLLSLPYTLGPLFKSESGKIVLNFYYINNSVNKQRYQSMWRTTQITAASLIKVSAVWASLSYHTLHWPWSWQFYIQRGQHRKMLRNIHCTSLLQEWKQMSMAIQQTKLSSKSFKMRFWCDSIAMISLFRCEELDSPDWSVKIRHDVSIKKCVEKGIIIAREQIMNVASIRWQVKTKKLRLKRLNSGVRGFCFCFPSVELLIVGDFYFFFVGVDVAWVLSRL